MRNVVLCALASAALAVHTGCGPELRLRFEPGQSCYVENSRQVVRVVQEDMPPGTSPARRMEMETLTGLLQRVEPAADGGVKVYWTFDRLRQVSRPGNGAVLSYDSDNFDDPDSDPLFVAIFEPMLGETLTAEIDKNGEVISFEGMDVIIARIEPTLQGSPDWPSIREFITDDMFKHYLIDAQKVMFPNRVVGEGDQWQNTLRHSVAQLGQLELKVDCTLTRAAHQDGRRLGRVEFDQSIRTTPKQASSELSDLESILAEPVPASLAGESIRYAGQARGTAVMDMNHGTLLEKSVRGVIKAEARQQTEDGIVTIRMEESWREQWRTLTTTARIQERAKRLHNAAR